MGQAIEIAIGRPKEMLARVRRADRAVVSWAKPDQVEFQNSDLWFGSLQKNGAGGDDFSDFLVGETAEVTIL